VAEITRVDLIKMIATAAPAYLRRKPHHVIRLSGVDLSELDLSFLDLSGAELVKANLRGARFIGTMLHRANVSESDFTDADCRGFSLDDGSAINTRFVRAKMGPLDQTKYPLVIQPWSMLEAAQFEDTDFTDADLRHARFTGSFMVNCIFRGAKLDGCSFANCDADTSSIENRILAAAKAAKPKRGKVAAA
jgi:uncharacterized protein YjbI with pentapeptide repeats